MLAFALLSPDLPEGAPIPTPFTANEFGCHGGNISAALLWSNPPPNTQSFAITLFDTYRPPQSGWWHWTIYNIPASLHALPRGASALPAGVKQGAPDGDAPQHHYVGPCPDIGDTPHGYVFTIYALNVDHLDLPPTATAADIDYTANAHAIARAAFTRWHTR